MAKVIEFRGDALIERFASLYLSLIGEAKGEKMEIPDIGWDNGWLSSPGY